MKVIIFNVFYPPIAFGGATIVAEQTTSLMANNQDDQYLVITLDTSGKFPSGSFTRYVWNSVEVIAISAFHINSYEEAYRGNNFAVRLDLILKSYMPDVALIHCIQGMGAQMITHLKNLNIPTALFVHDAWWLCEKQFMIASEGGYCFQEPVITANCRNCVLTLEDTITRNKYLMNCLNLVDKLIYPSIFFRNLHNLSGVPSTHSIVIKNGVKKPISNLTKNITNDRKVRFGFVGGAGQIKGSSIIRTVFEKLERTDYELVCVDNLGNLGRKTFEFLNWQISGKFRIRSAYTQDTIDDFFNEIDVLLFPSQWKESFGLAVREALIRHKWVIATDGGGTVEDIVDGINGRIIPIGLDSQHLKTAVNEAFTKDWHKYKNSFSNQIRTFSEQAIELRSVLFDISKRT